MNTDDQSWLSRRYLLYQMFTHMWFIGAVWLYFYRLFITDQQVGILDGMAFAIGLLAEVPSGALADKFGRARIVKLGQFLTGIGLLTQALASSFVPLFVGQAIVMIGISFVSGADEALFFNKLNYERTSAQWRKLVTRGVQAGLFGSIVALTLGGLIHTIDPRIPWILTALSFISAAIIIWPIKEDRIKSALTLSDEVAQYVQSIAIGFKQFLLPQLWMYVPIIITVQGLFYASGYGLLRLILLDRFHFDPFLGSIAVAASSLITVAVLGYMHKYADALSEKAVLICISLSAAAGLLLALADIGMWGFVVILVLYAGEYTLYPFMSEVLNHAAPEEQRATVLSVASFLRTLPYVVLAPLIGYLSTTRQLELFFVVWAIVICFAIVVYVVVKRRGARIKL